MQDLRTRYPRMQSPMDMDEAFTLLLMGSLGRYLPLDRVQFLKPETAAFLRSLPNSTRQHRHTDYYATTDRAWLGDDVPFSVLVALKDGAKIRIWPNTIKGKHGQQDAEGKPVSIEIILAAGEALFSEEIWSTPGRDTKS